VSILGILFSEARAMIMLPWPHGKESTHEVLRFSLQTGNFPLRTHWNNNDPASRREMGDLRNMIIKGIKESVPKPQNLAKAFDVQLGEDEGPADFRHRLKDQMRKHSDLNLNAPLGQGMLKLHFVINSWPDISKKLQEIENRKDKSLEELLREAQKVYV
jgi:hypothetical protein